MNRFQFFKSELLLSVADHTSHRLVDALKYRSLVGRRWRINSHAVLGYVSGAFCCHDNGTGSHHVDLPQCTSAGGQSTHNYSINNSNESSLPRSVLVSCDLYVPSNHNQCYSALCYHDRKWQCVLCKRRFLLLDKDPWHKLHDKQSSSLRQQSAHRWVLITPICIFLSF